MTKIKVLYYVKAYFHYLWPAGNYTAQIKKLSRHLSETEKNKIDERVNYYNQLPAQKEIGPQALPISYLKKPHSPKAYFLDTYEYARYFPANLKVNFLFGDITYEGEYPSLQKSRPVKMENRHAVLLKLDKMRHYKFRKDSLAFTEKKNMLIGRGVFRQGNRVRFMEKYFGHQLCDLGQINTDSGEPGWVKPKINIQDHFAYKFILSLEGYDVATNLKWILNSNSIAVMPKPTFETWFMEGKLIADVHYIKIKDDFSDLEARLNYFIDNPEKCLEIIRNARSFVQPFLKDKHEKLISLKVLEKYFINTGQI